MSNPYPKADCDVPVADYDSYDSDNDVPDLIDLTPSVMTCVTGLWDLEDTYDKCLENTLRINCPYVFFGDKKSIEYAKQFRGDYPTYYIEYNINIQEQFLYYLPLQHLFHFQDQVLIRLYQQPFLEMFPK